MSRRRLPGLWFVPIALAAALLARWAVLRGVPLRLDHAPTALGGGPELRGVYHVHSTRSDGRATPDEIALAAAKDGLDFVVVTDHNVPPLPPERRHGVLLVYGEEESTPSGHRVTLEGTGRRYVFWAHPLNRRVPWTDWGAEADGLEILSADDMWRDALRPPWLTLGRALLDAPASPLYATYDLLHRPAAALARYDSLEAARELRGGRFSPLCSVDAHGLPPYRVAFASLQLHLPGLTAAAEPARAALSIADALASGRFYCGLDGFRDASGLRLTRRAGLVHVELPAAGSAQAVVVCGGSARAEGSPPVDLPAAPGCHLEIRLPALAARWPATVGSWIYAALP